MTWAFHESEEAREAQLAQRWWPKPVPMRPKRRDWLPALPAPVPPPAPTARPTDPGVETALMALMARGAL